MRIRIVRVAATLLMVVAMAGCGGQLSARQPATSPEPSGPIATNLPTGVCAPTYQELRDPHATKIEAKLVARQTFVSANPQDRPGPGFQSAMKYFWVIAELGVFPEGNFPRPPNPSVTQVTPKPWNYLLVIRRGNIDPADPESVTDACGSIGVEAGSGLTWPSWFDQMSALVQVKIR